MAEEEAPLRMPLLAAVAEEDYVHSVWPSLRRGVDALLRPADRPLLSMEPLSRAVYNCCCSGLASRLQEDLLALVDELSRQRTAEPHDATQLEAELRAALPHVAALFGYLEREYSEGRLLEAMERRVEDAVAASRPAAREREATKRSEPPELDGSWEGQHGALTTNAGSSKRLRPDNKASQEAL
ncbi:hypothetical protein AB1Y20_007284 [Prymnesium parvum]|uniref:Uncharacterized protein n=1 Tax=Prymnesium parvum TaxID=97485 RepID=A0AB34IX61_PRYPA